MPILLQKEGVLRRQLRLCGGTSDSCLTETDEKGSCLVGMRQRRLRAQVREPVGWGDREARTVVPIIITEGLKLPGPL